MLRGKSIDREFYCPDIDHGYTKEAFKAMWKAAEAIIRPKSIQIYRNGNRWSVDLYNQVRLVRPLLFGTGGNINDIGSNSMKELFLNPDKFKIVPYPNTWEDKYIVAHDPYDNRTENTENIK